MTIRITPETALIGEEFEVELSDHEPGSVVQVTAITTRAGGQEWRSEHYYLVDGEGRVSLANDAAAWGDGARRGADTLLWAQRPESDEGLSSHPDRVEDGLTTRLVVTDRDGRTEESELRQVFLAEGVQRIVLNGEDGPYGAVFVPAGEGPFPAVVLMNGSDGGTNEFRAAAYASHGILTLTLAYFNYEGLDPYISNTELDYFRRAFEYVHERFAPLDGKLVTSGGSRGGELTLLTASLFPELISGAVAYVPGAFVHSAQTSRKPGTDWRGPAWLQSGEPLPNLFEGNPFIEGDNPFLHETERYEANQRQHSPFVDALRSREHVERARIPVERINGPVLLISGGGDKVWPGRLASQIVVARLAEVGHPFAVQHLDWDDAGHSIGLPTLPRVLDAPHPVSGIRYHSGGTRPGNAIAAKESFEATVRFIREEVYGLSQ